MRLLEVEGVGLGPPIKRTKQVVLLDPPKITFWVVLHGGTNFWRQGFLKSESVFKQKTEVVE